MDGERPQSADGGFRFRCHQASSGRCEIPWLAACDRVAVSTSLCSHPSAFPEPAMDFDKSQCCPFWAELGDSRPSWQGRTQLAPHRKSGRLLTSWVPTWTRFRGQVFFATRIVSLLLVAGVHGKLDTLFVWSQVWCSMLSSSSQTSGGSPAALPCIRFPLKGYGVKAGSGVHVLLSRTFKKHHTVANRTCCQGVVL